MIGAGPAKRSTRPAPPVRPSSGDAVELATPGFDQGVAEVAQVDRDRVGHASLL
jgi:hypothetical protein